MILTEPKPFREALESRAVRTLLPSELRTEELALLEPAIRERAVFSAGVTNGGFLARVDTAIDELLGGRTDRATQRMELKRLLGSLGDDTVDDSELTDLRSDARLNLILDTQLQQAQGYGHWKQGQDPAILDQWPAQELIRVIYPKGGPDAERPWEDIWRDAGGIFFADGSPKGRMIALKNDPIWTRISRFGTPYPPFDFNSGMDVQDVDRDTAIEAGLLGPEDVIEPEDREFNLDLEASPDVRSDRLREAISGSLQGIASFDSAGVLRFIGGGS